MEALKGAEGTKLTCSGCGVDVWPRLGGYWFLLLVPRGRVGFPGAEALQVVLCSGCGRRVEDLLESSGVWSHSFLVQATGRPE